MTTFLDIIKQRKITLQRTKKYRPLSEIKEDIERVKIRNNLKKALFDTKNVKIICEYKPASPSYGDISKIPIEDAIKIFQNGGASSISVITEETFFKSNIENLKIASKLTKLPLLRKDFIIDDYQIYEARASGASAVLLLASIYPDLSDGIEVCNYLGMHALVECENKDEIEMALKAGAEIIGINNRSFKDFTINFDRTRKLSGFLPPEIVLVSESGVKNAHDVRTLSSYGADALLVGTSVMGSSNMLETVDEIVSAAKGAKEARNEG